jgi:hypothetical protein
MKVGLTSVVIIILLLVIIGALFKKRKYYPNYMPKLIYPYYNPYGYIFGPRRRRRIHHRRGRHH